MHLRPRLDGSVLRSLLVIFLIPSAAAFAQPQEDEEETGGNWSGKVIIGPGSAVDVKLGLTESRGRLLVGRMDIGDHEFHVLGVQTPHDLVGLLGKAKGKRCGTFHSILEFDRFGAGAGIMSGRMQFHCRRHRNVTLPITLMRQFDYDPEFDIPPPNVHGGWKGTFSSALRDAGGELGASFEQNFDGVPTRFGGTLGYIEQDNLFTATNLVASVNSEGRVVIVGTGDKDPRIVVILEGQHVDNENDDEVRGGPPAIVGTYRIIATGPGGRRRLLDFGTFNIIAILIG